MEIAKIAVVVIKRPTDAVTVNSEKFILSTIYKILIIFLDWSCIRKYVYRGFYLYYFKSLLIKKKGLTFVRPSDGEPYF